MINIKKIYMKYVFFINTHNYLKIYVKIRYTNNKNE
jgi:hypothetical protein